MPETFNIVYCKVEAMLEMTRGYSDKWVEEIKKYLTEWKAEQDYWATSPSARVRVGGA
jgi:hypothetical protein